jgi:hypothetical protein
LHTSNKQRIKKKSFKQLEQHLKKTEEAQCKEKIIASKSSRNAREVLTQDQQREMHISNHNLQGKSRKKNYEE